MPDSAITESDSADNDSYVRAVHDRGLRFDLRTLSRRSALGLFGAAGLAGLAGCAPGATSGAPDDPTPGGASGAESSPSGASSSGSPVSSESPVSSGECVAEVPDETEGPFPGDGSNGANALTTSGVVRNDIRSSFGGATGVADGVPLVIDLTVLNLADACKPMAGAAIYVWQCDREGNYSMYSSAARDQNYLRGVAEADAQGRVRFTSIFPAAYSGRWPHIHFEVFNSVADATSGQRQIVKTSQIALPEAESRAVYATAGYTGSERNLSRVTLETDGIFRDDNAARQMATMSGDVTSGYTAALTIAVN